MTTQPNILYILADDLGFGDVSCLNPQGKIPTPHLDRLAQSGMTFTDAHSTSAVCSPSRYGILTGRYNWRSTLQRGIVEVYGPPLIAPDRLTVAQLLQRAGYHTGCIGKWHLGMGWQFDATTDEETFYPGGFQRHRDLPTSPDQEIEATDAQRAIWREVFSKPTSGGPTERGFDYYFGVDVPNWPPYCFIENDRTVGIPSELLPARLVGDNLASRGGPAMPYWHFEQLLPTWASKADRYIADRAAGDQPFFMYMPLTSPHTPLSVNKPWIGKSGLNSLYADLVMETDDVVGRVLDSLSRHGVADNTLVIFASDNGCAPYIGVPEMQALGHEPSAHFRGFKTDAWDGGHRIPCIASWPGTITPGSSCDQLVSLSDFFATCADIVNITPPQNAGEDSVSMLPLLRGNNTPTRERVVHHSISGKFAMRDGNWKLVCCPGSGGASDPRDHLAATEGLPLVQLYDMQADPSETTNLHAKEPQRVRDMVQLLKAEIAAHPNDVEVDLWKRDTMPDADLSALDDY